MSTPLYDEEDVSWLEALVSSYEELYRDLNSLASRHDEDDYRDEDPSATAEALSACRSLAKRLRAGLPKEVEPPTVAGDSGKDESIPF